MLWTVPTNDWPPTVCCVVTYDCEQWQWECQQKTVKPPNNETYYECCTRRRPYFSSDSGYDSHHHVIPHRHSGQLKIVLLLVSVAICNPIWLSNFRESNSVWTLSTNHLATATTAATILYYLLSGWYTLVSQNSDTRIWVRVSAVDNSTVNINPEPQ